jgi:ribonuclease Z
MRITILGSGSPLPDANRAGPSTLVEAAGASLLVDCGRGALMRLVGSGGAVQNLSAVLITHLHSDHITDLNDVITSRWALSLVPNPLRIVGPEGTARVVERTLTMLEDDIGYRLAHHDDLTEPPQVEVTEVSDGPVDLGVEGLAVGAAPTEHAPVRPTVGYRFEAEGSVAAVSGDTIPCEGLDRLVDGADVYVQTTVRRDQIEAIGVPRMLDVLDYHSTIEQAAETATRNGVRKLVLTHLVPPPPPDSPAEAEWAAMAAEGFDGEVVVARDLTAIEA